MRIALARPVLDDAEVDAVRRVIASGWITQGPEAEALEREFALAVGAPHACSVSSGTAALHCAMLAAGVAGGDEVITASHSFIATANAIRHAGATPVFVDIDPLSGNIDPDLVAQAIGPRTRAILAVHQAGMPCDLARLVPLTRTHGVALIEDAACAAGSEILWQGRWTPIGAPIGDAACFSFHPRKVITTGDGGMVTTANAGWDARMRSLRHHGMSVSAHARHGADQVIFESYDEPGYNYRLTDVQAAIGRVQLTKLTAIVARRRALAERYRLALSDHRRLTLPTEPPWARSNWQSYGVRLNEAIDQRELMQSLLDRGVATRRGVMCAHREPAWRGPGAWRCVGDPATALRHSETAQDQTVLLPLSPQMSDPEQDYVIEMLEQCAR